jgi:hypothetical protein
MVACQLPKLFDSLYPLQKSFEACQALRNVKSCAPSPIASAALQGKSSADNEFKSAQDVGATSRVLQKIG